MLRFAAPCFIGTVCLLSAFTIAGEFTLEQDDQGVTVNLDGQLFTRYLIKSGAKPILWPIIGPTGKEMTRAYPMRADDGPDNSKDHIHHRSLWFTHGDVNGVSFWDEQGNYGNTVHRKFLKTEAGPQAIISTLNDWLGPDGVKQCEDTRTFTFGAAGEARWIDVDITVKAVDKKVTFGDTKEGSFGIRVADTMSVDAKKGGRIVNSQGQTDSDAWGKPAAWVDYHGPIAGQTVGIAILNHPSSFRYPTHWHVRTYGLFAANPFGLHDFYGNKKDVDGASTLEPGESFTLRYRVLLHKGDENEGQIAQAFERYANEAK